jgi:ribosome-associated translation inhibitor RaiA
MPFIPKSIEVTININFGKLVIEHVNSNDASVQAAIDKATKDVKENTAQLEAGKGA